MGNKRLAAMFRNGATGEELSSYLSSGGTVPESYQNKYTPQNYLFWNAGRTDDGFRIDDSNADTWRQIEAAYNAGDVAGATELVNGLSGKGTFGGFYDDKGSYYGFVRGYKGGANASYQPVVGGRIISADVDRSGTDIWLTPDNKALHLGEGGALTDTGDTWSRSGAADIADVYSRQQETLAAGRQAVQDHVQAGAGKTGLSGQDQSLMPPGEATPWQKALAEYGTGEAPKWTGEVYDPETDVLWQDYLKRYGSGEAPRWTGEAYEPERDTLWRDYLTRYGRTEAPAWEGSPYGRRRDEAAERAAAPFSYDLASDPVWQAYRKQYAREGSRAAEDTLGRYAALTGGVPGTAAMAAAQQASGNYAARLTDKIPELYRQAYEKYLQEYRRQLELAGAYGDYDREEYARYRDRLDQWNGDRSFAYAAARDSQAVGRQKNEAEYRRYLDELDRWNGDRSFAYTAARDSQTAGRQRNETEYSRYLDRLDQWNKDRSFAYARERDTVSDRRYDAEWAQRLREYADAQNWKTAEWEQYLQEYGDKLSRTEQEWVYKQMRDSLEDARYADRQDYERSQDERKWQRQEALDEQSAEEAAYARRLNAAKLAAQYGDYSGLEALGIEPNEENLRNLAIAEAGRLTPVGSGSYRAGGGTGGGEKSEEYAVSTVNAAYQAYLKGDRSELTLRILESAGLADSLESGGVPVPEEPEGEYGVMDRVLADMQAQGRPWKDLQTELEAELRDERITRAEYEALREKYVSRGLNDGVSNLEGVVHRDGSPMSAGFTGVWRNVRDLADRQEKEKALAAMERAVNAGTIHEYEIDVMMDQLGW